MTKQFHVADAAGNGLQPALLARAGTSGSAEIFEDIWGGYFRTYGKDQSRPEMLIASLGQWWHVAHSAIRMNVACGSSHLAIDGVFDELSSGSFSPKSVRSVRIELSLFLRSMICPSCLSTIEAARMRLPVSIALLLYAGTELDSKIRDPELDTRFQPFLVGLRVRMAVISGERCRGQSRLVLFPSTDHTQCAHSELIFGPLGTGSNPPG